MKINVDREVTMKELNNMYEIIMSFDPTQNYKYMGLEYQELVFDDIELEIFNDMLDVFIEKISFFAVQQKIMVEGEEYEMAAKMRDIRTEITRIYSHFALLLFSDVDNPKEIFDNLNDKALRMIQDGEK